MTCRTVLLHAAAVLALAAAVHAQTSSYGGSSDYDREYGRPVDVSITDLEQNPSAYYNRAVRTRGRLETGAGLRDSWVLRDSLGAAASIVAMQDVAGNFQREAMAMVGQEVEVVGVVRDIRSPDVPESDRADPVTRDPGAPRVFILFWKYQGPPEKPSADALKKAAVISLENLLTSPGQRDGQLVRVVGRFRGSNLYGDLPVKSRRRRGDWVIKDETFAVWVTGKRPRGDGFDLDTSLKPDTDKWLEVVGRPVSAAGVTWIQAIQVTLSGPPSRAAQVVPTPPSAERPKVPPVIVFTMPVDGDDEVAGDSRFTVQFSKDMEESSFQNRVVLRYSGPVPAGERPITNMTFTYDRGRRTLVVDPGMVLAGGRQVELLLLPGIVDSEGLPLAPRASPAIDGIADRLRYSTGS